MVGAVVDQVVERGNYLVTIAVKSRVENVNDGSHLEATLVSAVEHVIEHRRRSEGLSNAEPAHKKSVDPCALSLIDVGAGHTRIPRVVRTHQWPIGENARLYVPRWSSGPEAHVVNPHLSARLRLDSLQGLED